MHKRIIALALFLSLLVSFSVPAVLAEDSVDWYMKAQNAATVGNYATAVQYYDKALTLDRNYAAAYAGKATALTKLGRFDEAVAEADMALAIKNNPEAQNAKAFALFSLGRDEEAVAAYTALFAGQVYFPDAYCNQGKSYIRLNQTEKAIAAFNRCTDIAPKSLVGWNQKGLALISLGRYPEALEAYNRCTQITTTNAEIWNNKGLAYAGLEDYPKALDSFKMAVNLDPSYAEAQANLEKAYLRKPFVTLAATLKPAITVTTPVTGGTLAATQTPAGITPAPTPPVTAQSGTPEETPAAAKTTYAPLSPLVTIVSLVSAVLVAVMIQKAKDRP